MDSIFRIQKIARTKYPGKNGKKSVRQKKPVSFKRASSIRFFQSELWLRIRYRVLVKQGRRCAACGVNGRGYTFHVDHIKPRSKYPELSLDEKNLQVLCEACNLGKSNVDETDWRSVGR